MTGLTQFQKRVKKLEQALTPKQPEDVWLRLKAKEMTDLLKKREEIFEALTESMTPAEKVQFELATVKEMVNSEKFKKLLQGCRNKNQLQEEGDNLH